MLYILGGAPRSGKTLLSKRMLVEKHIPYFPIDALIGTLTEGLPELEITHKQPFITKSERLWKLTKHLFDFFLINEEEYLIEGDAILPSQVKKLVDEGKNIRACFVGYTKLNPEEKLKSLRKYGDGKKDWTNNQTDETMLLILERTIDYSKYIKGECEKYGIKFFDVSSDFEKVCDQVFDYMTKK